MTNMNLKRKMITTTAILSLCLVVLSSTVQAAPTYHTHPDLIQMFKMLIDQHPTQASYVSVGKSYEGRDIWLFRFGNPNGGRVLWDGCMHGWEDIGSEIEYFIAQWLLTSGDARAQRILQNNYVLFVPVVNPDSYERENRDFATDRCGVDLNRNFPTGFNYIAPANTGYPNSYHGDFGGSEPETRALRSVFQNYHPSFYLNTHYGGGGWGAASGENSTIINAVNTLINQYDPTFVSMYGTAHASFGGNGMAVADAHSFGISSWLCEIAGGPGSYEHTAYPLSTVQSVYYPKMKAVFYAMTELVERSSTSTTYQTTVTGTGVVNGTDLTETIVKTGIVGIALVVGYFVIMSFDPALVRTKLKSLHKS